MPPEPDPTLPPAAAPAKRAPRKVIDLARAAEAMARVPVLDVAKRRLYNDWLAGARPRALRMIYGKPTGLLVDQVDDVLRAHAREQQVAKKAA